MLFVSENMCTSITKQTTYILFLLNVQKIMSNNFWWQIQVFLLESMQTVLLVDPILVAIVKIDPVMIRYARTNNTECLELILNIKNDYLLPVLTKTRSFWSYLFTIHSSCICPACEQSVLQSLEQD